MSTGRLRVATYNVHALKDDRAALIEVVRAIDPDVLALQEVPRHPLSSHRIAGLAAQWGLTWAGGSRGRTGVALMTSLRVQEVAAWRSSLPVARRSEPRGYAAVRVARPGHEPLTVIGTHFGLPAADRAAQLDRLVQVVTPLTGPLVVGGDFNERPGGRVWQRLGQWLQESPGGDTFPAAAPDRRIDALWHSPALRVSPVDVQQCGTRGARATASDHLPVAIDVWLPPQRIAPSSSPGSRDHG